MARGRASTALVILTPSHGRAQAPCVSEQHSPESSVAARHAHDAGPESGALSGTGLIEQERKRRRLRLVLGLGMLVVLGAGAYGILAYNDARARERVNAAYGSLVRCIVGEPLEPGERASVRFRATQLTAMAVPIAQRAKPGELPWPQTCAPHAHRLTEALRDAGRATKDEKALTAASERLAKLLQEDKSISADLTEAIELVWADAQSEQVQARSAFDVPLPPAPARPFNADRLKAFAPLSPKSFSLSTVHEEPAFGPTLRFVIDQKEIPNGPALCTSAHGTQAVKCQKLPPPIAALSPGLRLWGTGEDPSPPYVFAGDRGSAGILRSDSGERIDAAMTYGASLRKDGGFSFLSWDEKEKKVRLTQRTAGRQSASLLWSTDDVGNPYYNVGLLWDQLVWKAVANDGGLKLFTRGLGGGDKDTEIGELAEPSRITPEDEEPHIAGCRTPEATIVRVRGSHNEQMAFRSGDRWLAPVLVNGLGGQLTCRAAEGTITRIDYGQEDARYAPTLVQNRCSAAGCRTTHVTMKVLTGGIREMLPQGPAQVVATDIEGKLLVVWSPGGAGGVRMRIGPIEEIAKAPDVVVYDDFLQDSAIKPLTTLFEMRLLSRGDAALLLLSTFSGVHVLHIDGAGKITPTPVAW